MTASVKPSGGTRVIQTGLSVFRAVWRETIGYPVLRSAWTRLWLPGAHWEPLFCCSAVCGCPLSALWFHLGLPAASVSSNAGRSHWLRLALLPGCTGSHCCSQGPSHVSPLVPSPFQWRSAVFINKPLPEERAACSSQNCKVQQRRQKLWCSLPHEELAQTKAVMERHFIFTQYHPSHYKGKNGERRNKPTNRPQKRHGHRSICKVRCSAWEHCSRAPLAIAAVAAAAPVPHSCVPFSSVGPCGTFGQTSGIVTKLQK